MFDLTGKNALITGASGGIGGEIAKTLHAAGATVGLSGTRVEPLEALAAELGERAHVLPCNLSDGAAVDALPKQAVEAMGSVDILATGNPGQANYAASKAGMVGMSKSIAYEVASRGITVNCVAPGFIATAMTDKLTDDQKEAINKQIPAARMGSPEEIAAAALYLASDQAAYVTGTTLHVNGGMAML